MTGEIDELIVFLMREFGWTLEYTRKLVKKLPISQLNALIAETKYQKDMEDYQLRATIISAAINPHTKHPKSVKDIIGDPPTRSGKAEARGLERAAQKEGIILPKEV